MAQNEVLKAIAAQEKLFSMTYQQFSPLGVDRVLFTKLDEGVSFGSLFNFSVRNRGCSVLFYCRSECA